MTVACREVRAAPTAAAASMPMWIVDDGSDLVCAKAALLVMMHLVLSFLSSLEEPDEIRHYTLYSSAFEAPDKHPVLSIEAPLKHKAYSEKTTK
uniref:Secreted protein n=1 Tax=Echinococcus granulosus TaxID=6210 RepID=A0A068WXY8_ECHGR|nr:hypothetical protein EgrG_002038900 [Echinococcus granulosus]